MNYLTPAHYVSMYQVFKKWFAQNCVSVHPLQKANLKDAQNKPTIKCYDKRICLNNFSR